MTGRSIYATLKQKAKLSEGAYKPELTVITKNVGDAVEIIKRVHRVQADPSAFVS